MILFLVTQKAHAGELDSELLNDVEELDFRVVPLVEVISKE